MKTEMGDLKNLATAHMNCDLAVGQKWGCVCNACTQIRSLMGLEKMLRIRPLVRAIGELESRLDGLSIGSHRQALSEEYLGLYARLAAVMSE